MELHSKGPDFIPPTEDLAFDIYQDPEVANIIRRLEKQKQFCVSRESVSIMRLSALLETVFQGVLCLVSGVLSLLYTHCLVGLTKSLDAPTREFEMVFGKRIKLFRLTAPDVKVLFSRLESVFDTVG
ncbi:unnamed protein product [Echinostoma caproni]|uniref:GRAM domain-containing protein n=1 Tax=Echinostoma caproni TaxID=27848 RepID=A0A183B361_9TREM|nr:unnamed protein product [Echinostoma caproni]